MEPISLVNIESELSYAYLHAVASQAGVSCRIGNRHEDNNGIDAQLTAWNSSSDAVLNEVDIKIQLKATTQEPTDNGTHYSYFLQQNHRYDDLRSESVAIPRILVVLYLPADKAEWLAHSEKELALRRCAYWVSLRGAPDTTNKSGITIKIPKSQVFCPKSLMDIIDSLSRCRIPGHEVDHE